MLDLPIPVDALAARYEGPVRWVFHGDPARCAAYCGPARTLLGVVRYRLAVGGIDLAHQHQTWPNGARVLVMHQGGMDIAHIWAGAPVSSEAFESVGGYQFAVTGLPHRVVLPGSPNMTLADMVYVPWPDPRKNQRWEDVTPIPTGAMLREDVDSPLNPRWPFFPINTEADYVVAANLGWRYNIGMQVDGAPPTEHARYRPTAEDPPQYDASRPIYTSIASNEGQIRMAGAFMPAYGFVNGDIKYDRAPQGPGMAGSAAQVTLDGKEWNRARVGHQAPDADWYHDATVISVPIPNTAQTIPFVVMVDASSTFHAWPVGTTPQPGLADGAYADQSIKTNIPSDRAVTCKPPFPGWVYDTTDFSYRDFYASNGHQPFWPRYVWRFHPIENKVVGMCLQRTEPNYDVLKKDLDTWPEAFITDSDMTPASVFAKRKVTGDSEDTTLYPIMEDTPGFAEFAFSIALDSTPEGQAFNVQTCTFKFSMNLLQDELAAETSYPIAAAYLNPVQGTWSERGVNAEPGELLVAYLRLYEHPKYRQDDINVLSTGNPSFVQERFSRSFIDIKKSSGMVLATIPLMINDDFYGRSPTEHNGTAESAVPRIATLGQIMQLQLAEFSWLVRYEKTRIQPIEESDFTLPPTPTLPGIMQEGTLYAESSDQSTTGLVFGAESQIGIRFVHRNQIRKEEQYGVDLGVFNMVDTVDVFGVPLLLEKSNILLYPSEGNWDSRSELDQALLRGFFMSEQPGDSVATVFGRMASYGYIANIESLVGDEWGSDWWDIIQTFCINAETSWGGKTDDPRIYIVGAAINKALSNRLIPGDFFNLLYWNSDVTELWKRKYRIENFHDGVHGYLRAWQFMVGESFHQYFHTGPDGSYALSIAVPHINSTQPVTDPITGEVIGQPETPKPFPVAVGFGTYGWTQIHLINRSTMMMNDNSFLYEFIDELEKHEPDLGRPFNYFTDRKLTLALIDEIGFERGGHPVTSHLQLYKRAYQLDDVQLDVPEFNIMSFPRPRQYVYVSGTYITIDGIDTIIRSRDVTPSGGFLAERDRTSVPPGLATIPGLTLYQGNATEIDTPRFNAGMHGVGFYLTGWHEYPI